MSRTISAREEAARALCRKAGLPEDTKFEGRPMWESFLPEVDTVLQAVGFVEEILKAPPGERVPNRWAANPKPGH